MSRSTGVTTPVCAEKRFVGTCRHPIDWVPEKTEKFTYCMLRGFDPEAPPRCDCPPNQIVIVEHPSKEKCVHCGSLELALENIKRRYGATGLETEKKIQEAYWRHDAATKELKKMMMEMEAESAASTAGQGS